MDIGLLFPSKYLKAVEFQGREVTLTIKGVKKEALQEDNGGTKDKGIVYFEETPKALVLNRTNAETIAALFGRNTDGWRGHKVTFYPATISFGDSDLAIRVKGSPELTAPKTFELKLPRKKAKSVTLHPTGKKSAPGSTPATAPESDGLEPPPDFESPGLPA